MSSDINESKLTFSNEAPVSTSILFQLNVTPEFVSLGCHSEASLECHSEFYFPDALSREWCVNVLCFTVRTNGEDGEAD